MNFNYKRIALAVALVASALLMAGCTVKYSLSGASIPAAAKTFSVSYFPNNARMVAPVLSTTLTDALQDKFTRQTRLSQRREGGDLHLEGEITNYVTAPAAISGDEYAMKNRLTVTVRVRFTSLIEPQNNFDKQFSAYSEYNASQLLQEAESTLIPEIVEMLSEDIFNAAVSNW